MVRRIKRPSRTCRAGAAVIDPTTRHAPANIQGRLRPEAPDGPRAPTAFSSHRTRRRTPSPPLRVLAALGGCLALSLLATACPASAQSSAWWGVSSSAAPTLLPRHGPGVIVVTATNLGDGEAGASDEPVTLTDVLPSGVQPETVEATLIGSASIGNAQELAHDIGCSTTAQTVVCTYTGKPGTTEAGKPFNGNLAPYEGLRLLIRVNTNVTEPAATSLPAVVTVAGGKTTPPPPLETKLHVQRSESEPTPFGVEENGFQLAPEREGGAAATQAGSHPFQLTTSVALDQTLAEYHTSTEDGLFPSAPALPRDLRFRFPPGLIADAASGAIPRCTGMQFATILAPHDSNACPAGSAIGVVNALINLPEPVIGGFIDVTVPLFNLTPTSGEPARFGFEVDSVPVLLDATLPAGGDYAAEVVTRDTDQAAQLLASQVTVWGTPGEASHDSARGWGCLDNGFWDEQAVPAVPCEETTGSSHPTAFLTLPTSCQPLQSSMSGDSWPTGEPGNKGSVLPSENTTFQSSGPLTECETLAFDPSISVEPESHAASTPTALNVAVEMPQPGLLAPKGRAESALRATTVRLPPGLTLNPSAANALEDCAAKQFDFLDLFGRPFGEEGVPEEQQTGNETSPSGPADCPDAAKVGTVQIQTPLLSHELAGSVYLAAQNTSPFRSPLALYLVAEDPESGVRVKLAGSVQIEPDGQVISTFANTPQVPFTSLHLHLFGGERASQSTPPACGPATTTSEFLPWSGQPAAHPESTFQITSGAGGGACPPTPLSFTPGFRAGPSSPLAGAFSPFVADIGRPDGQQALTGISLHLAPGFAAVLASVTPCPEPPIGKEWSCGAASEIGEAHEYSGLGSEPVMLTGQVYLTSGYDGAPFGLLVRTLAKAGPFDLGWVNVRSRIDVDPSTAAVTVTSDPGPRGERIPSILDGVPVQLKALEVAVNRPSFEFNPTNCNLTEITGTLNGSEGAAFGVSDPFKAQGCQGLPFHPALQASTTGQASRVDGASLTVNVTSQGLGVANIKGVSLQLPKALPARESTLKLACLEATFNANPASCPAGSVIGSATIHTPVFTSPLSGPAYLVSHGGAAFPDVEFVLQGEGVKVVLDGKTDIKSGITYSRFESAPDAPFTTFETVLPMGPHSALGAYLDKGESYDLCGQNLQMPTVITGQNGAVIEQDTKIAVEGCGGVASYKVTLAQRLAKALAKCASTYRHSLAKRAACERKAHAQYTAVALAACRKTDRHSNSKRAACEAQARRTYGARVSASGARRRPTGHRG